MSEKKRITIGLEVGVAIMLLVVISLAPPNQQREQSPQSDPIQAKEHAVKLTNANLPAPPIDLGTNVAKPGTNVPDQKKDPNHNPVIELLWPNSPLAREQLYSYLHRCRGMRFGILRHQRVQILEDTRNIDLGTVARLVQGPLTSQEQTLMNRSKATGQPIRLFPTPFNQQVLGAFNKALGTRLSSAQHLSARYYLIGAHLQLVDVRLDSKQSAIKLSLGEGCQKS